MSMTISVSKVRTIALSNDGEINVETEHTIQEYQTFLKFCKKHKIISNELYHKTSSVANVLLDEETTTQIFKGLEKVKDEFKENEKMMDFYYTIVSCDQCDVLKIEMF